MGILRTWLSASFRPGRFYDTEEHATLPGVLLYAGLCALVGTGLSFLVASMLGTEVVGARRALALGVVLLSPGLEVLALLVGAGFTHLMLVILGSAHGGYGATLKAVCYAAGPQVFAGIPVVGVLAGLWSLVLTLIGVKRLHDISTGTAVMAVLVIPLVLALCLGGLFFAFGAGLAGLATAGR